MQEKRDIYPIELIKTGIEFLLKTKNINKISYEPIRALVVYNLLEMDEGFLPINREYKPLGLSGYSTWAEYKDYPFLLIPKDRVDLNFLKKDGVLTESFYFFQDDTYPANAKNKKEYILKIKSALDINEDVEK